MPTTNPGNGVVCIDSRFAARARFLSLPAKVATRVAYQEAGVAKEAIRQDIYDALAELPEQGVPPHTVLHNLAKGFPVNLGFFWTSVIY
jgi:hypothetical protein